MTQQVEDTEPGVLVCVLSVDTCYGGELQREFHSYKTHAMAGLFAGKFAQRMQDEGYNTRIRGVFVQKNGQDWETVGSYFDV